MEETDVEREDCSERVRELRLETGVVFGLCVCSKNPKTEAYQIVHQKQ